MKKKKDEEKSQDAFEPKTSSSQKLTGKSDRSSRKKKSVVKDKAEKDLPKSTAEDQEKTPSTPDSKLANLPKGKLGSSKGTIVYSWDISAGTYGFNSYPTYDYHL
jgi:hypothetical protein